MSAGPPAISVQQAFEQAVKDHQGGRLAEAESIYRQILSQRPDHADAMHLLGVITLQKGDHARAVELISRAISLKPQSAGYHMNLGLALAGLGQFDESIAVYQRAIALEPDFAEVFANLSDVLLKRGRLPEAIAAAQTATKLRPQDMTAANNLGNALLENGQLQEAVAAYSLAISLRPDYAGAHYNLGNALRALGQFPAAIESYSRAIALQSNYAEAYNNLGRTLIDAGDLDGAARAFASAVAIQPASAAAHNNLANALKLNGFLDQALNAYEQAMRLAPNEPAIRSSFIYMLFCSPRFSAGEIFAEQRKWNDLFGKPMRTTARNYSNDRTPHRKLRIGYVSADFRNHAAGLNLLPILRRHDRSEFEIICYSNNSLHDPMTEEFRRASDHWVDIFRMGDDALEDRIRRDEIDILMDLSLHSEGNRLQLFARKPAPVQATFIGYPGSTGLDTIDWRFTDPYLDPPGESEQFYSERCLRLPNCFWVFDPDAMQAPRDPVAPLPASSNGFFTFGCQNNFCKIHDQVVVLWAKVLHQVPNSRFLLLVPSEPSRRWVLDKFASEGIDPSRIEILGRRPGAEYMKAYDRIDLFLDTFPCSGHVTSLDSLWMGVPPLTLVGPTVSCRASYSILCNLDLREFAADTPEQFIQKATEIAADPSRLANLRQNLRRRMLNSPLCDAAGITRDVEAAYRRIWIKWCQEQG